MMPVSVATNGAVTPIEEATVEAPAEVPVEEPVEVPVEEPVEVPVEVPVEEPVEEAPIETPVEEPKEEAKEEAKKEPTPPLPPTITGGRKRRSIRSSKRFISSSRASLKRNPPQSERRQVRE
jgi:outer membrane biosynthesis protein TonB